MALQFKVYRQSTKTAPVVQRIECKIADLAIEVRFLAGAPLRKSQRVLARLQPNNWLQAALVGYNESTPEFAHIGFAVKDLQGSKKFYSEALAPLGIILEREKPDFLHFTKGDGRTMLWIHTRGQVYQGIDAVRRIIVQYPGWKSFARIGALPGIEHLLRFSYRFVANNRHAT